MKIARVGLSSLLSTAKNPRVKDDNNGQEYVGSTASIRHWTHIGCEAGTLSRLPLLLSRGSRWMGGGGGCRSCTFYHLLLMPLKQWTQFEVPYSILFFASTNDIIMSAQTRFTKYKNTKKAPNTKLQHGCADHIIEAQTGPGRAAVSSRQQQSLCCCCCSASLCGELLVYCCCIACLLPFVSSNPSFSSPHVPFLDTHTLAFLSESRE